MLGKLLGEAAASVRAALDEGSPMPRVRQVGVVSRVGGGVAQVRGLPALGSEEVVEFAGGARGIAINLEPEEVGVVLLTSEPLVPGAEARASGRPVDVPVGDELLGRVIDGNGRPLDDAGPLRARRRRPVEAQAPAIMDRAPVTVPLQTGLKVVDALVPIGRGQRELIVGDRQTGKTTLAVDTILNQRGTGVVSVYCAIGQRGTAVARVIDTLRRAGALGDCIVVVAAGEDPPGLQYITPFAAMTIAEHFMHAGRDALVVFDDLTRHARAYRELSLLLRRPPGREAYPGDIFYLHARLLERSTHLRPERGGGSITALPIVETQAQDISAYIPTNLISITDGQVYLSPDLFHKGILPPVEVGRSVSRVGGRTQLPAFRKLAGAVRLAYSQFEELETFSRFATRLDEDTRATIERGRRVREALKQAEHAPLAPSEQVAVLFAASEGLLDRLPVEDVEMASRALREHVAAHCEALVRRIDGGETLEEEDWKRLREAAEAALAPLGAPADAPTEGERGKAGGRAAHRARGRVASRDGRETADR